MNYILYFIALIILCGVIKLIIYISKKTTKSNQELFEELLIKQEDKNLQTYDEMIYDLKPSNIYSNMFSNPSIWFGYSDFNEKDVTDKIYVKST
jgi:hypothetical protein